MNICRHKKKGRFWQGQLSCIHFNWELGHWVTNSYFQELLQMEAGWPFASGKSLLIVSPQANIQPLCMRPENSVVSVLPEVIMFWGTDSQWLISQRRGCINQNGNLYIHNDRDIWQDNQYLSFPWILPPDG